MTETTLKWRRRKEARPAEIIDAAMDLFVEKGFAAAKLDEVAKRAGVAKGTLYLYFETKEDVFRAVVQQALATSLRALEEASAAFQGSLAELVPMVLARAASGMGDKRIPAVLRLVMAESRAFPDLARIWHDEVIARVLTLLIGPIAEAQARGEVRPGDPKLYAFSIIWPMVTGLLFHETFGSSSPYSPGLDAFAVQHAETMLRGMSVPERP